MRKMSSEYFVNYSLLKKDRKQVFKQQRTVCFSELYSKKIDENNILILRDFLAEETKVYSKIYLKRLAKIFKLNIKFNNDNEIELKGFKSIFYVKAFTSLFRMLFEVYEDYNDFELPKKNNLNFLKSYIKNRNNSGYKDMLSRLIYYYQLNNCFQGAGHGITSCKDQIIPIKTIEDLHNWTPKYYEEDMQMFFKKK